MARLKKRFVTFHGLAGDIVIQDFGVPERRGNCYVTCEAIYHLTGGAKRWRVKNMQHEGDSHWFLVSHAGTILDPTVKQFKKAPDYSKARGRGFLTKRPSKRARALMETLLWQ